MEPSVIHSNIKEDAYSTNRIHPMVRFVNGPRTTAVAAKFRSLTTRTVDIWFEDGKGGSMQGTLRPGQETTTNAYEGHVFFFTEKDNKKKEIARVTIRPDKVNRFLLISYIRRFYISFKTMLNTQFQMILYLKLKQKNFMQSNISIALEFFGVIIMMKMVHVRLLFCICGLLNKLVKYMKLYQEMDFGMKLL